MEPVVATCPPSDQPVVIVEQPSHGHDLRRPAECHPVQQTPEPSVAANKPVRASARVCKRAKLDTQAAGASKSHEDANDAVTPTTHQQSGVPATGEAVKRRRAWGLWTVQEKNTFFEALNESGKDFDAITAHFARKQRRFSTLAASGGVLAVTSSEKTKDQVRHFYYRTWHKISKTLTFTEDVQKATQELYALINYGELRKRMGRPVFDKNMALKLQELINQGWTLIKVRGKTLRVRTPVCRCLRRINFLDKDGGDLPKLPVRMTVELRPVNSASWCRVQQVAHNPRARTFVPLSMRVSALINFFTKRWGGADAKLLEKLLSANPSVSGDASSEGISHSPAPETTRLRLLPRAGSRILRPSVHFGETINGSSLCLTQYRERLQQQQAGARVEQAQQPQQQAQSQLLNPSTGQTSVKGSGGGTSKKKLANESSESSSTAICDSRESPSALLSLQLQGDDATDGELLATAGSSTRSLVQPEESVVPAAATTEVEEREQFIARIRAGWTLEDADSLSLGELYIMFGVEGKLELEYSWEPHEQQQEESLAVKLEPKLEPKPEPDDSTELVTIEDQPPVEKKSGGATSLLSRLAALARLLPLVKEKQPICPCGHVCSKSVKVPASSGGRNHARVSRALSGRLLPTTAAAALHPSHQAATLALEQHTLQATAVVMPTVDLHAAAASLYRQQQQNVASAAGSAQPRLQAQVEGGHVFRRPLLAPSQLRPHPGAAAAQQAFKAQLDQFRPKYCNRRGRSGRKNNVVVQRMLPLLPKTAAAAVAAASGGHPRPQIMTLKVLQPSSSPQGQATMTAAGARLLSFATGPLAGQLASPTGSASLMLPMVQQAANLQHRVSAKAAGSGGNKAASATMTKSAGRAMVATVAPVLRSVVPVMTAVSPAALPLQQQQQQMESTSEEPTLAIQELQESPHTNSTVGPSSGCLTSLLGLVGSEELSLGAGDSAAPLLDVPLANHHHNFQGLLGASDEDGGCCTLMAPSEVATGSGTTTPPLSPTRILKESADAQWLNSEVVDFSLSSFLGHLDSPLKGNPSSSTAAGSSLNGVVCGDDTRLSQDVEAQLQCLMSESSVDYMAKFADLAAQIAAAGDTAAAAKK